MRGVAAWITTGVLLVGTVAVGLAAPPPPPPVREPVRANLARVCPGGQESSARQRLGAWASEQNPAIAPLNEPEHPEAVEGLFWATPDDATRVSLPAAGTATAAAALWAESGPERGLSATPCVAPHTDAWFVGVRSDEDHAATVELVNLDATEVEVSLTFGGPEGPVPAAGARGITVPAQGTRSVALGPLLEVSGPATVHVEATVGRVASFVRVQRWDGTKPLGADWIPPSAPPERAVAIPGVPDGDGERSLVVMNPGERVVQADIEVLGDAGSYQAAGAETVDLPPGATRVVDLEPGLGGQPGSVLVRASDVVTAAVEVSRGGGAAADDPTVLAGLPTLGGVGSLLWPGPSSESRTLVVANAGSEPATVEVAQADDEGTEVSAEEIVVPAQGSVSLAASERSVVRWQVSTRASSVTAVMVAEGTIGGVGGLASLPVEGPPEEAGVRTVTPDPFVGV
ncbi:MAG: DUF5719 family protein [Propioniciclava sp.]